MPLLIGKHTVSLWLIGVVLAGLCLGVFGAYMILTVNIPLTVEEPIEILNYPVSLTLYPGEVLQFNITVQNHATLAYSISLNLSLDDTAYRDNYVTMSNDTYLVYPGIQSLNAWLAVSANAPPLTTSLRVGFQREPASTAPKPSVVLYTSNVNFYDLSGVRMIDVDVGNAGTSDTQIIQLYVGTSASMLENQTITQVTLPAGGVQRITISYSWISSLTYVFKVISSSGQILEWSEQAPANSFMGSSSITITNVNFMGGSGNANNTIQLTMKNTGTKQVTIGIVKVNNVVETFADNDTGTAWTQLHTLSPGDSGKLMDVYMGTGSWLNGNPYKIELYDGSGQGVGSTQQNAPGA
jgi:hypothetical protein